MAYTATDKAISFFRPYSYTGTGSSTTKTDVGFTPDMAWGKNRANNQGHGIIDSVRGNSNYISSNTNNQQLADVGSYGITSGGFTFPNGDSFFNGSGNQIIFWSWLMGGTAPTKTYKVVVVSDGGNKYRFRNSTDTATFGASAQTLDLQEGGTYTFDVSDSTMSSHPFVIGTAANGTEYSTGVTYKLDNVTKTYSQYTSGFSAATSRQLIITVAASAPALYYWCSVHSGMGGAINTNTTFGSSNFDGTIKCTVSHNSATGFSIARYVGTGSGGATIGHELGVKPHFMMFKNLDANVDWRVWHHQINGSGSLGDGTRTYRLNNDDYWNTDNSILNDTAPTTSVATLGSSTMVNASGQIHVAYFFVSKPGFSKFGKYWGNFETDGPFIYTGFKPSFVMVKKEGATGPWRMFDTVRADGVNPADKWLDANTNSGGVGSTDVQGNLLSNGFKLRDQANAFNTNDTQYVYISFGQTIVGGSSTQNIPATAR